MLHNSLWRHGNKTDAESDGFIEVTLSEDTGNNQTEENSLQALG